MTTVVAAIIRRDNRILLTRRFNNVHLPGLWEFPGGKVEAGESLEDALKREIMEELGVQIAILYEFFKVDHAYPTKTIRLHFYECSIVKGEPQPLDVADLRWVAPRELSSYPFPDADKELVSRLQATRCPPSEIA
jgi:mutator protein MutT